MMVVGFLGVTGLCERVEIHQVSVLLEHAFGALLAIPIFRDITSSLSIIVNLFRLVHAMSKNNFQE